MADSARREGEERDWSRTLITWGALTVALVVAGFIAASFVPRWWAHKVGDQANESFAGGIMLGLFYGFVFTLLPLLVIVWAIRKRRTLKAWAILICVAALVALPNLFTLSIVFGTGGASHAGERTLDVQAPGFRGASLAGALLALALICFGWYLLRSRRRAREREAELRSQLREEQQPQPPPQQPG